MKNARELGFDSKVIDRLLIVNEEKCTSGTIPEHNISQFLPLELCFNPKASFRAFAFTSQSIVAFIFFNKKRALKMSIIYNTKQSRICIHRLTTTLPQERSYTIDQCYLLVIFVKGLCAFLLII